MIMKRRTIYLLLLLAGLLAAVVYLGFVHWPFQAQERPILIYVYSGR